MSNCGGYNYSKTKCCQTPKASVCGQARTSCGQVPKPTSSCVYQQQVPACQQAPKSTPMTSKAATCIQSNADKTAIKQDSKASDKSVADEDLKVQEEQKKKEFAMSYC